MEVRRSFARSSRIEQPAKAEAEKNRCQHNAGGVDGSPEDRGKDSQPDDFHQEKGKPGNKGQPENSLPVALKRGYRGFNSVFDVGCGRLSNPPTFERGKGLG